MYKFDPRGGTVEQMFRAIAIDQLDEALADLEKPDSEGRSVVHESRRRCKKLRGLLRLLRPAFPGYALENEEIRGAAAMLSHLRDAEVLRQTLANLAKSANDDRLKAIAAQMPLPEAANQEATLNAFRARLVAVRERAGQWTLDRPGPGALILGFKLAYRSARKRMAAARAANTPQHFHEWRKANKYHGFHVDLLKRTAADILGGELDAVDKLSGLLGLHHDLAVLGEAVERMPEDFGSEAAIAVLLDAVSARRATIEIDAFALGRQIFAERPSDIARRFATYWQISS